MVALDHVYFRVILRLLFSMDARAVDISKGCQKRSVQNFHLSSVAFLLLLGRHLCGTLFFRQRPAVPGYLNLYNICYFVVSLLAITRTWQWLAVRIPRRFCRRRVRTYRVDILFLLRSKPERVCLTPLHGAAIEGRHASSKTLASWP